MKIIDQTQYLNNVTGKINLVDRGVALLKYGAGWFKEIDAQSHVIFVMEKLLDNNFTLLRNVTPPALEVNFPLILVGPTGVFVMYVTPLTGTYRAKGDMWGTISGNNFKDEKPNLLIRTERMARALQVFLQSQGQTEVTSAEAILLCSDPAFHVDSLRPIIRIIMRDALERFIISLTQARVVFSTDSVQRTIDRILNPPKPVQTQPTENEPVLGNVSRAESSDELTVPAMQAHPPVSDDEPTPLPSIKPRSPSAFRWMKVINKRQWIFLISMFVIWILLAAVFLITVIFGKV